MHSWKHPKKGIQVFILTAQFGDLLDADPELSEDEDPRQQKIEDRRRNQRLLLDQFSGNILVRSYEGFHAKYCIIDPVSPHPYGIMMTCNATVGPMTGKNIEIAVTLTREEIKSFFSHFLFGFWEMAEMEFLSGTQFDLALKNPELIIQMGNIALPVTSPKDKLKEKYTTLLGKIDEMIQRSQNKIILSAWSFDKDHTLLKSLHSALDRQVKITIFTKPRVKNSEAPGGTRRTRSRGIRPR